MALSTGRIGVIPTQCADKPLWSKEIPAICLPWCLKFPPLDMYFFNIRERFLLRQIFIGRKNAVSQCLLSANIQLIWDLFHCDNYLKEAAYETRPARVQFWREQNRELSRLDVKTEEWGEKEASESFSIRTWSNKRPARQKKRHHRDQIVPKSHVCLIITF